MPTTSRPLRPALSRAAALALAAFALWHALLTPAGAHLAAEDAGCPHDRPAATAGAGHCPPAFAIAPPGGQHPEHDPAARACEGAATVRPLHPAPAPPTGPAVPGRPPLPVAGPTRSAPGTLPHGRSAASRQILRC
ncbi:hypothetical protein [Streptomyces sp. CdTB01]|uniref:hypothetical protein n=1 Tax=Streptomyces sp. CdTB01 TaxID=1725411 RepID=UPI00073A7FE9|nr:hypothetical protein [Streptomyces sp. CdTB01]ALV39219.1 hypothetical protein AS200_44795 [Streptomyces sp. CdTB01]